MQMNRRQLLKSSAITAAVLPVATGLSIATTGCSTSWIDTAIADLPTAVSIATSILGIVAVATGNGVLSTDIAALINTAATAAKAGLLTIEALIQDYKTSPNASILDKIDVALTDLQTNLSAILQVGGIKNQALQVTIATAVGLAIATISAIQLLIPAAPKSSALRRAAVQKVKTKVVVPQKEQIVSMFNAVVVLNGYADFQVK